MSELVTRYNGHHAAIIAFDAGGAFYLSKILKDSMLFHQADFYLGGPALDIFYQEFGKTDFRNRLRTLDNFSNKYDLVLTGTGWQSDHEIQGIQLARAYDIHSVSILDHWANYKRRFTRGSETVLPAEIIVFDDHALKNAQNEFPEYKVRIWKHEDPVVIELSSMLKSQDYKVKNQLLYVTEPISQTGKMDRHLRDDLVDEEMAFSKFAHLTRMKSNFSEVTIRVHPSEKSETYIRLAEMEGLTARISLEKNPLVDIVESKEIYGLESIMLSWSARVGVPTFTLLPINERVCLLPDFGIRNLDEV